MLVFIVILVLACIISFFIIRVYTFFCLKSQYENYKSATYIYLRKKMDILPKLINEFRYNIGETDELIQLIKIRNNFNESLPLRQNLNILHDMNRIIGIIISKNASLERNEEVNKIKEEWYLADAALRENSDLYISTARDYNAMLDDIIVRPIVKLFKYEEEKV